MQFEVATFLGLDLHLQTPNGGAPQQLPTRTMVRQWQSDLKHMLRRLTQGQGWTPASATLRVALRFSTGRLVVNEIITPLHEADRFMFKAVETLSMCEIVSGSAHGKIASGHLLGQRNGAGHKIIAQSLVEEQ